MKLSDKADKYYRDRYVYETQEYDKTFNPEIQRLLGLSGHSGPSNRAVADRLIKRWDALVNIKVQAFLEAYEMEDALIEQSDIDRFFRQLKSGSDHVATAWSTQHPRVIGTGYLQEGFRPINVSARTRLSLVIQKAEFGRTGKNQFTDRDLMLRCIELARNCTSEPGKMSPKVGAIIARHGIILGEAFRGET